jgi:hypothetical protein
LAAQYEREDKPVLFLEHDVDNGSAVRKSRWYAAHTGSGSIILPLIMTDSGYRWNNGRVDFQRTYQRMVDETLAHPPAAELTARYQLTGSDVAVTVMVTNLTDVPLGPATRAEIHAMVYEDRRVIHTNRFVRHHTSGGIPTDLAKDESEVYELTIDNGARGVNWSKAHVVVLVDYQPPGSRAFDNAQAAVAVEGAMPTATPVPTETPMPTETPVPTETPAPTNTPEEPEPTPTEVEPTDPPVENVIYLPAAYNGYDLDS